MGLGWATAVGQTWPGSLAFASLGPGARDPTALLRHATLVTRPNGLTRAGRAATPGRGNPEARKRRPAQQARRSWAALHSPVPLHACVE
jgi:hypothetical protein